ncbi:hypothetical protein [Sphingomonas sp. R86521]|uniref:hypothetical protein n=1 Tax=Sphingomonas sp. R86521 TaxID=3093860 RepID=UPI0036D3337E
MLFTALLLTLAQSPPVKTEAWKERHFPKPFEASGCIFTKPSREVSSLKDLPKQVRWEVMRIFTAGGGIADLGGEYNSTNFIDDRNVLVRRFIRSYLNEDAWFKWCEYGGIVRGSNSLALTRQRDGDGVATIFRATPGRGFPVIYALAEGVFIGSRAFPTCELRDLYFGRFPPQCDIQASDRRNVR